MQGKGLFMKPRWFGPRPRQFPSLAVIGCGGVAAERHLPALARLGWRPRVLVDPRIERASKLSRRFKARRAVRNVSELAAGEIQAALVATNMASHASVSLSLLENGVHVFVEKPMAVSFDEASAMVKTAAANSACLAVGHIRRFMFINRWVKKLIQGGALGNIESFDVREGENFRTRSGGRLTRVRAMERTGLYSPAFWDPKVSSGGVLLDTGSHTLDTLLWQIGEARVLDYQDDSLGGVEADAFLQLKLPNGATGAVELSRTRKLRNTAIITGSLGQVEVSLHRNEIIRARPDNLILYELDGRSGASMPNEHLHQDMFKRELEDWLQAIHSGGTPFVSGASATTAIRIIDCCYHRRRPLHPREPKKPSAKSIKGKTMLVTGASGFIGSRLVEKIAFVEEANVRAAVRTFRNAARVSPFPPEKVELRHFNMAAQNATTEGAYESLVKGCDTVFHLARDTRSHKANEEGVRQLGAACQKAGVRRFIYVSSMSVYEPLPNAPLTEESPAGRLPYNDKLAAEREVMRMIQEDGLQAAIIQPTIVYGPFSSHWTDRPANMLVEGAIVLPSPGDGICNAVYIDDLIHALMLAAQREEAIGKTFLISGPERPTWLEFYSNYATALGREDAIRLMPYDEINRRIRGAKNRLLSLPTPKQALNYPPLRPLRQAFLALYDRLGDNHKAKARRFYEQGRLLPSHSAESSTEFLPTKRLLDLYAAKCPIQIDKARRILGYEPEFTLERGMEITTRYLCWAHGRRVNERKD